MQDANNGNESDTGAFRVIISKPGEEPRSKTMEDVDPYAPPVLDVDIPSWRIGRPQLTGRGMVMRGSSYAPTEELYNASEAGGFAQRQTPKTLPHFDWSFAPQTQAQEITSPNLFQPLRSTYLSTRREIEPDMFDALTFKPTCDDRTIVRYSPATGSVTAATPPRLVAEITSPSFLDYDLISDFFLTFRIYLDPAELLKMLFARLRWAVQRHDEIGMIVRVRTFVALRHWMLNYFVSDFVVDYNLRTQFCDALNQYMAELQHDPHTTRKQMHILGELKKCWRRTCAQYWDGPEFDEIVDIRVPVAPGGIAGHRNPRLDPSFWEGDGEHAPQLGDFSPYRRPTANASAFYADVLKAGQLANAVVSGIPPDTPEHISSQSGAQREFGPDSPMTMSSMDVVSCSFPNRAVRAMHSHKHHPLAAHPIPSTSTRSSQEPIATTPKTLSGKRVRPQPVPRSIHKGHAADLREQGAEIARHKNQEILTVPSHAGSLVKGAVLPPTQPFVDVPPHGYGTPGNRQTTLFESQMHPSVQDAEPLPGAMSGGGMRKLLAGVRRALGSRNSDGESGPDVPPPGPRGVTTNRVPGPSVVPNEEWPNSMQQQPVRIDLLAAEVSEDFREAIRQEGLAEAERARREMYPKPAALAGRGSLTHLTAHRTSDMNITTGSKSIVIVDDTVDYPPAATQVLVEPSSHSFKDLLVLNTTDPTPPDTPPLLSQYDETPRQSSNFTRQATDQHHFLHGYEDSTMDDEAISGLAIRGNSKQRHTRQPSSRSTFSRAYPPLSGSSRIHRRAVSARTQLSLDSIIEQHVPSLHGNSILRQPSVRSFDAATARSEDSVYDMDADFAAPPPLRLLRRRPGGDLKQVNNVDELIRRFPRKSHSIESFSVYSESMLSPRMQSQYQESQTTYGQQKSIYSDGQSHVFSLGRLADKSGSQQPPFPDHPSKAAGQVPIAPSSLAKIPDNSEDGGIESALLKLEGRYDRAVSQASSGLREMSVYQVPSPDKIGVALGDPEAEETKQPQRGPNVFQYLDIDDDDDEEELEEYPPGSSAAAQPRADTGMRSFLSEASEETRSSKPLLNGSFTNESRSKRFTGEWTDKSILNTESDDEDEKSTPLVGHDDGKASKRVDSTVSFEFIHRSQSMIRPKTEGEPPQSFLRDESDDEDLSTDISTPELPVKDHKDLPALDNDLTPRLAASKMLSSPISDAPTEKGRVPRLHADQLWSTIHPGLSPIRSEFNDSPIEQNPEAATEALRVLAQQESEPSRRYSVHLPFILAFSSDVLAQQFTLIEKDALNEIDWKELIDMRWKNAPISDSRSWVDFLRNSDARGVEVVIARFNIMVKWAVSEILLTQQVEERAKCIIKLIHIAAHCRALRNFATLAQVTIALSSNEVSRLARTWNLVPAVDLKTLKSLEALVTPTRNFYNLRAEMEAAGDAGCIPFVGIYTHDLLVNGQRPAEIASSLHTAPLIHFERCRIAATVVKTLLRLIEASNRYTLKPVEGIIERCLWMGTLGDEEIRRLSDRLD